MKVLVVGGGGREHCLAEKLKEGKNISLFGTGENAGINNIAKCKNIPSDDVAELLILAKETKIDITLVGPEAPLARGIVDEFKRQGLKIFGPSKAGAKLETSKLFAKELFAKYSLPTAEFKVFGNHRAAIYYVEKKGLPLVIKADGLAAGKGVVVAKEKKEAVQAIEKILEEKIFGSAGDKIIIEEYLEGEEFSFQAVCDGEYLLPLLLVQDYKRIGDNDTGPNTGGMGSYAPCPWITKEEYNWCTDNILNKTLKALTKEGIDYVGVLYAGLIRTSDGPKILEYNCRFGDPETQSVLPLLESDFLELICSAVNKELPKYKIKWKNKVSISVVLASQGYPEKYDTAKELSGLDKVEDVFVFHSGTRKVNDKIISTGGRVIAVTALSDNFKQAREKVYREIEKIKFENKHYRTDIGKKVA